MSTAIQFPAVDENSAAEETLFQRTLAALEASAYLTDLELPAPGQKARGVYALYYRGKRPTYRFWSTHFQDQPVFVGHGQDMFALLRSHFIDFDDVINLYPEDFRVRAVRLVSSKTGANTEDALAKQLVEHYQPLWNDVVHGFVPDEHRSSTAGRLQRTVYRKPQVSARKQRHSTFLYDILDLARAKQKQLGRTDIPEAAFAELEDWAAKGLLPD